MAAGGVPPGLPVAGSVGLRARQAHLFLVVEQTFEKGGGGLSVDPGGLRLFEFGAHEGTRVGGGAAEIESRSAFRSVTEPVQRDKQGIGREHRRAFGGARHQSTRNLSIP